MICAGLILDRTKSYSNMSKFYFVTASLLNAVVSYTQTLTNKDDGSLRFGFICLFCFFGFFSLPLLPVCMETAIECTYPAVETTSSGLLLISGQIVSIFTILIFPVAAKNVKKSSETYLHIQKCVDLNATHTGDDEVTSVADYTAPMVSQTCVFLFVSFIYLLFFKCPNLRWRKEQKEIEKRALETNMTSK
jgi:Na+/melibiose symporter-like transporter